MAHTYESRDIINSNLGLSSTSNGPDTISKKGWEASDNNIFETLRVPLYAFSSKSYMHQLISSCIVAEKTFRNLRQMAEAHPDVHCVAVSHSDKPATDKWLQSIGGEVAVDVVVDHERQLYGRYGLGVSSMWHVFNPWSMSDVFKLAKAEQIKNRPTESGTRWQTAGTFGIDASGIVKYVQVAKQAR